jgi:hypothetical protein
MAHDMTRSPIADIGDAQPQDCKRDSCDEEEEDEEDGGGDLDHGSRREAILTAPPPHVCG